MIPHTEKKTNGHTTTGRPRPHGAVPAAAAVVEPAYDPAAAISDEESLLGSLLALTNMDDVDAAIGIVGAPANIVDDENRPVYEAICTLRAQGVTVDWPAVESRLRELGQYDRQHLLRLFDAVPGGANWRRYAGAVRDHASRRRLIAAAHEAVRDLCDGGKLDSAAARLSAALAAVAPPATEPAAEYQPLPLDCLPPVVREYVSAVAAALPCAPEAVAWPLLAMLASAVGNSRRIALKASWSEPAVLWSAVVMPSGKLKSPAHDAGVKPLGRRQQKLIEQYRRDMRKHELDRQAFDDERIARRRSKAPSEPVAAPEPPTCRRLYTSDATVEAVAAMLAENPRGILLERDELAGWLQSFDRYASRAGADLPAWLSMHRAGHLSVDRKTGQRHIHVPHAAVSVCGTIQPGTLRRCLTAESFDSGLAARILFVLPPSPAKRWTDATVPHVVYSAMDALVGDLLALELDESIDADGDLSREPMLLPLDDDARQAWVAFFDEHAAEQDDLTDDRQAAAWSKLEAYAARFALIFSLCRCPSAVMVDSQSMRDGITLTRWAAHEAKRVYSMLAGESDGNDPQAGLIAWVVARGGRCTVRELAHGMRAYRSAGSAEAALQALVSAGLGRWDSTPDGPGRPKNLYIHGNGNVVTVTKPLKPEEPANNVTVTAVTTPEHDIPDAADDGPPLPQDDTDYAATPEVRQ